MSTFDVVAAIEEFLGDSKRTSLELPHMTTGQRKSTKKLLEQYSELHSESFGFGAERRLVLFKQSSQNILQDIGVGRNMQRSLAEVEVTIKNTFVDDWVAPEAESIMFRSLQNKASDRGLDFASVVRMSKEGQVEITGAGGSNLAKGELPISARFCESIPAEDDADASSPHRCHKIRSLHGSPVAGLTDTIEELQVRNTFIHFEGMSKADERAVQSMPHGMFKQCILAECIQGGCTTPSTISGYDTPDTPTSVCERDSLMDLIHVAVEASEDANRSHPAKMQMGSLVIVEGLTKVPAFNGCSAVVQSWDEETSRYNILLATPGGCQQAKIKHENLREVMTCP